MSPFAGARGKIIATCWLSAAVWSSGANAEPMRNALLRAYSNHPTLKAERAAVLASREEIESSKAGFRPKITANATAGLVDEVYRPTSNDREITLSRAPRSAGIDLQQNLFDGFRTTNTVSRAQSGLAARAARAHQTEQMILLAAATAYVDVWTDELTAGYTRENMSALRAQLAEGKERHGFGDATRTELAQIQTRLASAQASTSLAVSNLKTSRAAYERIIGPVPEAIAAARPLDTAVPTALREVLDVAAKNHPAILGARHGIGIAVAQVKIERGAALPSLSVTARLSRELDLNVRGDAQGYAAIFGSLSIPIYDGGETRARVRQASHTVDERRFETDAVIAEVRSSTTAAWNAYNAGKERIQSAKAQLDSAEAARNGIREEWRAGERTLREFLDAQQDVLVSRINLAAIERERVLSTYALAQAIGRLTLSNLARTPLNAAPLPFRKKIESTTEWTKESTFTGWSIRNRSLN